MTTRSPEIKCATVAVDGLTLHLYRVWFYGLYGAHQEKVAILARQLRTVNAQIG